MNDESENFNIDNPKLPKSIRDAALTSGGYPYDKKLDWDEYKELVKQLQEQLVLLQDHMLKSGERMIIIFEGRDAAGKGGAIKTYLEYLNPRYNISGISSAMSTISRRLAKPCFSTAPGTTGPESSRSWDFRRRRKRRISSRKSRISNG
jgi:hypothetical protein